mmetsp:Transcript_13494/g.27579  ORF Transcript_13494/g.27579 Transcript_13494/m.27579 type:complete len:451 (-) Transcript_13494:110-1462(-)
MAIFPDGIHIRQLVLFQKQRLQIEQLVQGCGQRPHQLIILQIQVLQVIQQRKLSGNFSRNQPLTQLQPIDDLLRDIDLDPVLSSHFQQFIDSALQLLLEVVDVLAEDSLPFAFVDRGSPLQSSFHWRPRPGDEINDHEHKPLMQMILGMSQLHPVLVDDPIQRPVLRGGRIGQDLRPPGDGGQPIENGPVVRKTSRRGRSGGRIGLRGGDVGFVFRDERHGDGHGDDDDEDETAPHHESAAVDEVFERSALELFVGGDFLVGAGSAVDVHVVDVVEVVELILFLLLEGGVFGIAGGEGFFDEGAGEAFAAEGAAGEAGAGGGDGAGTAVFGRFEGEAGGVAFGFDLGAAFGFFAVVPPLGHVGVDYGGGGGGNGLGGFFHVVVIVTVAALAALAALTALAVAVNAIFVIVIVVVIAAVEVSGTGRERSGLRPGRVGSAGVAMRVPSHGGI